MRLGGTDPESPIRTDSATCTPDAPTGGVVATTQAWSVDYAVDPVPDDFDLSAWNTTTEDDVSQPSNTPASAASIANSGSGRYRRYYKGCWYPWAVAQTNFNPAAPFPPQYQCRYGVPGITNREYQRKFKRFATSKKSLSKPQRRKMRKSIIDSGRPLAYPKLRPSLKKWRSPTSLSTAKNAGRIEIPDEPAAKKVWPMFDSYGAIRAYLQIRPAKTAAARKRGVHYWAVRAAGDTKKKWKSVSVSNNVHLTKVQGKACYIGGFPRADQPQVLANSKDAVLIVVQGDVRARFYISAKAFPSSTMNKGLRKGLRTPRTDCGHKPSGKSYGDKTYALKDANTDGKLNFKQSLPKSVERGVLTCNPKNRDKKKAKDCRNKQDKAAQFRTYKTYNADPLFNKLYVSSNTNSVFKGGIAKAVVPLFANAHPTDELRFKVYGLMGHCDVNAFDLGSPNANRRRDGVTGLRWAYGSLKRKLSGDNDKWSKPIYGWVPLNAVDADPGEFDEYGVGAMKKSCYAPKEDIPSS